MLPLDVGDDGERGVEVGERPAVLVGLQDEHPPGPDQRVTAELRHLGADHRGRIDARGVQHQGEHRRRGGLAVRARHRDKIVVGGQFGQPLAATTDRDTATAGGEELRMIVGKRAGCDDDVHAVEFRVQHGRVGDGAHPHPGTGGTQDVQAGGVLRVAAADHPAAGEVDVGERGQARPRDPQEADVLRVLTGHDTQ